MRKQHLQIAGVVERSAHDLPGFLVTVPGEGKGLQLVINFQRQFPHKIPCGYVRQPHGEKTADGAQQIGGQQDAGKGQNICLDCTAVGQTSGQPLYQKRG